MNNLHPSVTPLPMSARAFREWGTQQFAYIKQVNLNGHTGFAVYAANGRQLGMMENRDTAMAAAIRNELEPVSVH